MPNNRLFSDEAVPLDLLRKRAFNMRWASHSEDIIPLTAADPDFPICPSIQERLIQYIRDGIMSYAAPEGLPQFREEVARWFYDKRNIECTSSSVFAIDSAASALAVIARASLREGDEVFIPDPVDFLFEHTIHRVGARALRIHVTPETSAEEFIAEMEARISWHTRMLWLCNPHNPLGVAYSKEWLSKVCEWAVGRGLRIVSDEIWSDIVYLPNIHTSIASLSKEIAQSTVTIYGFSKSYGLAGLRVGCILCTDSQWLKEIIATSDAHSTVSGVCVLSQVAAISALVEGGEWLQDFVDHLHSQRDYVLERLSSWPGVTTFVPQATYVAFPRVVSLESDVERLCETFHREAHVALVPGCARWFGVGAQGHVRICFATSRSILKQAFDRLEKVVFNFSN